MKPAAEVLKDSRKSLTASSDEESKRTKFEKAKKQYPKIKGNKDVFCWTCHKSGNVATCSRCPRAYHLKCGHLESIPEPSKKWICPECDIVQRANSLTSASQLKTLSQMLGYVIDRMKLVRGSEGFCESVDTNKWHDYLDYVVKPMDLLKLADNVRHQVYKSTEDFLADFRWLVHDSYVYNSVHSEYTKIAKSMSAVAKQECEEIKNCADCYLHAYSLGARDWFVEPCTTPHILVWAQLSGFPYWPGKVMRHVNGDMVDVRFFGDHSRANVPVTSCFLYSRLMPCAVKKNHPKIADGIEEAEQHVKRLRRLYGNFYYAQYRVRYHARDEDTIRKLQLPGFQKPGETPEFLKKVELERAEKMILDKDFQFEMKQMPSQSKKVLAPIKRKSIEKTPKAGSKRMLVQLNTPMGVKCAIMNCSGSESDSSPKHISEKAVENTTSRMLNSNLPKTTPTKRMRLSDKFESLAKGTLQKTPPEKEAMIKQVEETSPKELADIYKSISPNKPKTPIKDSGIIESISRKLLTPTSLRSIRAANESKEETPRKNVVVDEQMSVVGSVKFRQNGLQCKYRGSSLQCPEDSDGDSDALVIASRESSPIRCIEGTSPRKEHSPAKIKPPVAVSSGSCNSELENGSAEKIPEVETGEVPEIEEKNCSPEKSEKNVDSAMAETGVNGISNSESHARPGEKIIPRGATSKYVEGICELRKNVSCVGGDSESCPGDGDQKDTAAAADGGDGNYVVGQEQVTKDADVACDSRNSTSVVTDRDVSPNKAQEKSDTVPLVNGVLDDDSPVENIGGNSNVTECSSSTITEINSRNKIKPEHNSVVDLDVSSANDSDRSVLDLLNGDLSQLYDNLASQCSASDESANNSINTDFSVQGITDIVSSSSDSGNKIKRDQIFLNSRIEDDDDSPELPNEVTSDLSRQEISNTTETVMDPKGPTPSTSVAKPDVDVGHSPKCLGEFESSSCKEGVSNKNQTVVDRVGDRIQEVEKVSSPSAVEKPAVDAKDDGRSPKSLNEVETDGEGNCFQSVEKVTSSTAVATPEPSSHPRECDSRETVPEPNREFENTSSLSKIEQPVTIQSLPEKSLDESQTTSGETVSITGSTEKGVELAVKPPISPDKAKLDQEHDEISAPTPPRSDLLGENNDRSINASSAPTPGSNLLPKSTDVFVSLSNCGVQIGLPASTLSDPVVPDNDSTSVKSSGAKTTTLVFTHSSTENALKENSVKNVETLARRRRLSVGDRGNEVKEKSSCSSEDKAQELFESGERDKCKTTTSPVQGGQQLDNFVTITSSMSLSHLSSDDLPASSSADLFPSTSARTQPIARKPSISRDLAASAKRKVSDPPNTAVKKPKVKEVGKDVVASGMPRPIIIKVEPEDQIQESPSSLAGKAEAGPTKPNIKVVRISNLMERPPPANVNKICHSPKRNLIPPFNPKKDMSDVRALIEAKKQFISAKLKADIYEMLDQIKAEYESHIDLLASVSDRQLQHFENTFETDKTQLYEDFKNKLRDQMDLQITEIKRKQWCANCGAEASFHCCWNHAYCGDKCQKEDWSTHSHNCTQYSMSATDPYIRSSPRFRALLEKQHTSGANRKISLQDLIDLPVAVSVQNSPTKAQPRKTNKKVLASNPAYHSPVPTISIPENELPELPRPPPSAKSFLTAPVQRLNNGEQISFDNGKRAYRIVQQSPGGPKTLKVVGPTAAAKNQTINSYAGPLMRLEGQGRSFALVVGGDTTKKLNQSVTYGALRKNVVSPPSSSGQQVNRAQTVTIAKRLGNQVTVVKKTPSVRVMEDNELASILARNHLRDTYIHASS
ncbi:hypothetical protein GE061_002818 [Apolygus lucorum]|uniref:Protein kinase C-binding protein 1 n=1 Tax=Apolygus lucorum TaxID=248454 RepID=A0A6A4JAL5_APOLU|nr:hypothetical protein GE061_002818 [Apolygus lucorum]